MKIALVVRGESPYCIRLCAEPDGASEFAAEELRRFVEKASGARLVIEKGGAGASPCIRIGNIRRDESLRESLGTTRVEKLTADGHFLARGEYFSISMSGRDIIIAGSGPRGTCYGVYEFLERFLDCGFGMRDFEAAYVSEAVAKRNAIEIPADVDIVQGPAFPIRTLLTHWGPRGPYAALWALRQRCNVIELYPEQLPERMRESELLVPQGHHHEFFRTVVDLALEYYKEHPGALELDQMRRIREDSSRAPGTNWARGGPGRGLFCFSSPATVDFFATGIKEYARRNPGTKIVQLTTPDGGFYNYAERGGGYAPDACYCPACQEELERIQTERAAGRYADWGAFVLKFRNAVMEKVAREYPDLHAVSLAYINYSANPSGVRPHPHLLIWYTIQQGDWFEYHGKRSTQAEERLLQWVKAAADSRQVTIWNARARRRAYCGFDVVFEEEAPLYVKYRLGGGNVRPGMPYSQFRARMLWDPSVPRETLENDYARRNFHAAAPVMRAVADKMRKANLSDPAQKAKAREEIVELLAQAKAAVDGDEDARRNVAVNEALLLDTTLAKEE